MLIKIKYNEESQIAPVEIINNTSEIYTRVEHNITYINPDWTEKETANDGSMLLKFITPWNKIVSLEARTSLYELYKNLTINQQQIQSLIIYDEDIVIFDSDVMGFSLGTPFITDTALNIEEDRDNYMAVTVPLLWKKGEM